MSKAHYQPHLWNTTTPFFKGETKESPRKSFVYWNDDGQLVALRVNHLKIVFLEQRNEGLAVWREEFAKLRMPKLFHLRADPFERGDTSLYYDKWFADRGFYLMVGQAVATELLASFKEFPPRQKPASFNLDEVMEKLTPKQ